MMGIPGKIGNYEIIREIGRGGMGVVYLAKHPSIDTNVALKVLIPDPTRATEDPVLLDAEKRFKNEAEVCARLQHPRVIRIWESGKDPVTGYLFIAMDYVSGNTLKAEIRGNGRYEFADALPIIKKLAEGLNYIHSRGVLHRDIKPSNVMFQHDEVILMDFGISQSLKGTVITETGKVIGSIPNMPPERIDGLPGDERSDIYSFALLCYEMLAGENPFDADTATAIIKRVATIEPVDLSDIHSGIPKNFAAILKKMYAKNQFHRPNDLREIINYEIHGPGAEAVALGDGVKDQIFCWKCGAGCGKGTSFCSECGTRLVMPSTHTPKKAPAATPPATATHTPKRAPAATPPATSTHTPKRAPAAKVARVVTPPTTYPATAQTSPGEIVYAGFWRRFWASFFDGVFLVVIAYPLGYGAGYFTFALTLVEACAATAMSFFIFIITFFYFAGAESSHYQATLGKSIMRIIVTDMDGNRISFWRAFSRNFSKLFSSLILYIGWLMAGFTDKKQTLHDMMSGCLVVKRSS